MQAANATRTYEACINLGSAKEGGVAAAVSSSGRCAHRIAASIDARRRPSFRSVFRSRAVFKSNISI